MWGQLALFYWRFPRISICYLIVRHWLYKAMGISPCLHPHKHKTRPEYSNLYLQALRLSFDTGAIFATKELPFFPQGHKMFFI